MKDWQVVKLQVEVLNPQEGSSPQAEALNPQGDLSVRGFESKVDLLHRGAAVSLVE